VFSVGEALQLPVYRFMCPDCRKTMSLLPAFVEPHHQSAIDVKEAALRAAAEGCSLAEIAEASKNYAGGGYNEKTIQRWRQTWNRRLAAHEERLWAALFHLGFDSELPRERLGSWLLLFKAWGAHSEAGSLFACLLKLARSPVAVAG